MTKKISISEYRKEQLKNVTEDVVEAEVVAYLNRDKRRPHTYSKAEKSRPLQSRQRQADPYAKEYTIQRVQTGWSDRTAFTTGGRGFLIECKRPVGGVLTYDQATVLKQAHDYGVLICVARSAADVELVERQQAPTDAMLAEVSAAIRKGPKIHKTKGGVNEYGF